MMSATNQLIEVGQSLLAGSRSSLIMQVIKVIIMILAIQLKKKTLDVL